MRYPHAKAVLTARIEQLHGTQSRLANLLGISRQLMLTRQYAASRHNASHGWWSNLLIMDPTWLSEEVSERALPNPVLVAAAVELNRGTFKNYRRQSGRPRKVKS